MAGSKSRISASTDAATDGATRVEIVSRGEARRAYTPDERATVLTEAAMPSARVLVVAQRYGISPSLVYRWRREAAGRPALPRTQRFVPLLMDNGGTRQGGFVPPSAPMQDARGDRIEVVLCNGRLLRVGAGMDAAVVARLAAALAPHRQWLAQQSHRRTHAVVLGGQRKQLTAYARQSGSGTSAYAPRVSKLRLPLRAM